MTAVLAVVVGIPLVFTFLIWPRFVWRLWPNVWTCALFWAWSALWLCGFRSPEVSTVFIGIGIGLNAVVTLANGGLMPVRGRRTRHSVWAPAARCKRLVWLGDVHRAGNYRYSIGDVFIAFSVLAGLIELLLKGVRA